MRLRDVGEFGLIDRIARIAGPAGRPRGRAVVLGIGDDAAVVRARPGEDLVATTDALVEGVHFRFATQGARAIGARALAVNLSDLAAMGARPLGALLALAAPPGLALRTALDLARGLVACGRRHACPLVGGNVTRARETSLTVTALGAVTRGRALLRSAARPGDRILVTGTLGGAALALARAERRGARIAAAPEPRLRAGRILARTRGVGACIDLSDGLLADLGHVLEASGAGAELDVARLPAPRGFVAACRRLGLDPEELLLVGGEDYELLFTVRPGGPPASALARRLGVPVAEIGTVTRRGLSLRGARRPRRGGWRHF
jgi:thiamine-monophosphate kinase